MSTVECYDLHLYCDEPGCDEGSYSKSFGRGFGHFVGRNQSEAYKAAREAGWVINPKKEGDVHGGSHARCPRHA